MEQLQATAEVDVGQPRPAAWIGSREDYTTDRRYGGWVEVTEKPRDVMVAIKEIIDRTPADLGRQWNFCELRDFGGWMPAEQEGLPVVMHIATGIRAFGEHYGGLARALGADSPALGYERYQVSYLGSWSSPRDFAEQVVAESGWQAALARLPRSMRPYLSVDYNRIARDAQRELTFVRHRAGVWVYDPRVW